jgi:manganese efflux pump family protein
MSDTAMPIAKLLALAVAIGANNLAAALALGALGQARRWPRVALVFGAMEFSVPLVGIWLGRQAARWLGAVAAWLGPALLIGLGVWVATSLLRGRAVAKREARQVTTWGGLLALSFGLAIDNVVVGFSLGLGEVDALLTASVIAVAAVAFSVAGLHLGRASRRAWERAATVGAGVALIAIGVAVAAGWL